MKAKRTSAFACLAALIACLALLAACKNTGTDTESGTNESVSDTATGLNEDATAPVRYDYLEADVSKDVQIDKTAYTDMKLTLPASLNITDDDAKDYINNSILFEYRTADNGSEKITDKKMKKGDSAFIY